MNNLILDALEQTAARLPEKIAFADEQTEVSFSALVRRAQSVAAALIPLVPPRSVVGFYMDKGVETVVGFMGAVYAGCAYAQLNLRHPAPRWIRPSSSPTGRIWLSLRASSRPRASCSSRSWKKRRPTRPRWPPSARR